MLHKIIIHAFGFVFLNVIHIRDLIFIFEFIFIYLFVAALAAMYRKTSNISNTLAGIKIVDYSDVAGASPVGAAPTTSSFWT